MHCRINRHPEPGVASGYTGPRLVSGSRSPLLLILLPLLLLPTTTTAQHLVIFDENDARGANFRNASHGFAEGGDLLDLVGTPASKLPVNNEQAFSGASSGRISYRHQGGRWEMFIASPGWVGRDLSALDTLIFFLNGPRDVPPNELPRIGLEDTDNEKSDLVEMSLYMSGLDGDSATWQRVAIPLADISVGASFDVANTKTVRFTDSGLNDTTRTLWIDLIVAIDGSSQKPSTAATDLDTRVGEQSVILRWTPAEGAIGHYVYRSGGGEPAQRISESLATTTYVDFEVENGTEYGYAVEGVGASGEVGPISTSMPARPAQQSDDEFLDLVARTAFDYFWFEANPANGLIKDRSTETSNSSIAAVGFGLTAIPIGIDHGWIDRDAGLDRVLTTIEFFWNSPHGPESDATGYRGLYYHFLNMETGRRAGTTELSTIDTALLLAGILFAKEYFDGDDERERQVRALADSIYNRIDWVWASPRPPRVGHGWRPENGFIQFDWGGYNEAMILYILALGSPTIPIPASAWSEWTGTYRWESHFGYEFVRFPPLFGHQYTHAWVDFRGIQDGYMRNRGIDYFENSRRATLANRAYCVQNPGGWDGYAGDVWGLTASDGPQGYRARGAPPAQNDDGTITPTAAGGSIAFTPEESTEALRAFYQKYLTRIWGPYGFRDAFNIEEDWFGTDYLGIDQGPILLMIENLRTDGVWSRFMQNADVLRGLDRATFRPVGTSHESVGEVPADDFAVTVSPNPSRGHILIKFEMPTAAGVELSIFDSIGRQIAKPIDAIRPAGLQSVRVDASRWAAGLYHYVLTVDGALRHGQIIHIE